MTVYGNNDTSTSTECRRIGANGDLLLASDHYRRRQRQQIKAAVHQHQLTNEQAELA